MKRQDARNAKTLEEPGKELDQHVSEVLVSDRVVVELEAIEVLAPIHWVHGIDGSYLKATGSLLGLLIGFNAPVLLRGVRRIILTPWPPGVPGA